uniref:T-complex protein 1 subunit eta n=1 Tax=Mucochytrium quahogii TaxID=96639 RepID=A0A7S2SJM3_9STRA|mmetsp:Transcript_11408/g.18582  ORF Transcript_11408/g.18582 Transcript_11408/m.18582 type:complete len:584 (-) Transcript_11408:1241-2992(-)|eukprot:CAMPEP_0203750806 /NCGR_PEP_ID=MMETSP0098-20131031/4982_1 /ASSEMBLY_ACC=CAM_ASM_000208 /TAXON_ID=96639 /ORGANISM=" , Strain NY0313808BC1" /LENGTH=583 /DNA_ID=CAMNT_0050640261 /DNA_START=98 /DNA_END=1849 /DNA_ORIENTATION=-
MSQYLQPSIILLREGTDQSQGKGQLISNINACMAVADVVRTTLGPRGMDKLIYEGHKATISNDGAEILKLLDIVHPAARSLCDIACAQDAEVGDGTTSVTLIACQILNECKSFIEDGVHPQILISGLRKASLLAIERITEIQVGVDQLGAGADGKRLLLERVAGTALNSKLICGYQSFFAPMCVEALSILDQSDLNLKLVGIKKITGGSVTDSFLVKGVAFKKTFSYAGFEQQPKKIKDPKVLLLNVELELKSEKENAEVRIDDPSLYQSIVDAEWKIIYDKLDQCVATGATVILSKLPIGDLATQYFADRNLFCAGRVPDDDLDRVSKATGAAVQTTTNNIPASAIGSCGMFEEKQVGGERYNFLTECTGATTCSIVLRGGSDQFVEEAHRSLHDALMVVKRSMENARVVAGGGAVEMELSRYLRAHARTIEGKEQLVIMAFAKALEVVPRQLCDNAGLDSTDILNQLRQKHFQEPEAGLWYGVDVNECGICDTFKANVWEPASNKLNSLASATEAACLVLSVDETVRNPASEQAQQGRGRGRAPPGGGMPMSAAMGGQGLRGMGQAMGGRGVRTLKGRGGK